MAICPTDCCHPALSGPRYASCAATRAARPKRGHCSTRFALCTIGESRLLRARWVLAGIRVAGRSAGRARAPRSRTESQASACLAGRAAAADRLSSWRSGPGTCRLRSARHCADSARERSRSHRRQSPVAVATAQDDEHELELIAAWCRAALERDPHCRLLIVDAKLRQRRNLYDRLLSQTLAPSEWFAAEPRAASIDVRNRRRTSAGRIPDHRARAAQSAAARPGTCDSTKWCAGCACHFSMAMT